MDSPSWRTKNGFYWIKTGAGGNGFTFRYVQDGENGRRYFGDVYQKQGNGPVESRIYRSSGDTFKNHITIAEGRDFIEQQEKECR